MEVIEKSEKAAKEKIEFRPPTPPGDVALVTKVPLHAMENVYSRLGGNVLITSLDTLFAMARKSSLWPLTFGLACCAIEMMSTFMSHHDLDRFGVVSWVAPSPRQADLMIVPGTLTWKMAHIVKRLYLQMAEPKWVIAMGCCAIAGGAYRRSYSVVQGVDKIIPVDIYVPGCPPRPEALMDALIKLQDRIVAEAKAGRQR